MIPFWMSYPSILGDLWAAMGNPNWGGDQNLDVSGGFVDFGHK